MRRPAPRFARRSRALARTRRRTRTLGKLSRNPTAWLWKDITIRMMPFAVAAGLFARRSGVGMRGVGVTRSGLLRQALLGTAIGVPMAGLAAEFRSRVAPEYTPPRTVNQVVQAAYYFGLNAPIEEVFWRGTIQTLAIRWLAGRIHFERRAAVLGWALTTTVFGAYHRLGGWSWRTVLGATVSGGLFGATYLLQPRGRSIVLPTIIHGFATSGFLCWGDLVLHRRATRQPRALRRAQALELRRAPPPSHSPTSTRCLW